MVLDARSAPPAARLLIDVVNTVEWQTDAETWTTPEALAEWLHVRTDRRSAPLTDDDLRRARGIREGLREVLLTHAGHEPLPGAVAALNAVLTDVPVHLRVDDDGQVRLASRRHALRHYAASTWLRLGTPINEVAEYLGDDPRTVLAVYAHVLGDDQRRAHLRRLTAAEKLPFEQRRARPSPGNRVQGSAVDTFRAATRNLLHRSAAIYERDLRESPPMCGWSRTRRSLRSGAGAF